MRLSSEELGDAEIKLTGAKADADPTKAAIEKILNFIMVCFVAVWLSRRLAGPCVAATTPMAWTAEYVSREDMGSCSEFRTD